MMASPSEKQLTNLMNTNMALAGANKRLTKNCEELILQNCTLKNRIANLIRHRDEGMNMAIRERIAKELR